MTENKETLKDKFRNLVGLNRSGQAKLPLVNVNKQSLITHEFWVEICASSPLENRLEKMKEAIKIVEEEILQDSIIKKLWIETKDLLQLEMPHEVRLFQFRFTRSIIKGQYRRLGMLRAVIFQALQEHDIAEDTPVVIQTFELLSECGKDVELFDQEIGSQMLKWMQTIKGNTTLLSVLVNIMKFNSSYLDVEVVVQLVSLVCDICISLSPEPEKKLALQVIDAIICYSSLPNESLYIVTVTLCHTLNMKKYCGESWKLMRNLLGTHLGHSCVSTMCGILQDPKRLSDWPLLRSAVFFIGMGLWGSVRVKSLKHTPQAILPSFHRALLTKNLELTFEVALTIQRLVRKFGHELQAGTWDHVLDIVLSLLDLADENAPKMQSHASVSIKTGTHDILTFIEKLIESDGFSGSLERVFALTGRCASDRPKDSVFLHISHKLQAINPTKQNWIAGLVTLIDNFYTKESRSVIRIRMLEVLGTVIEECMELYEDELVTEVLLKSFSTVSTETDLIVKLQTIQLIIRSCLLANEKCPDLFALLRMVLDSDWTNRGSAIQSNEYDDIKEVVEGFLEIFLYKLTRYPGTHAVGSYHLVILFLKHMYLADNLSFHNKGLVETRVKAFRLLLSLRANEEGQLGIKLDASADEYFTAHVLSESDDLLQDGVGYLSFGNLLDCVLSCFKRETHWPVLDCVVSGLCGLLQNKYILVGCRGHISNSCAPYITKLSALICTSMMSETELMRRRVANLPSSLSKTDILSAMLSVLSGLVCYHQWLDVAHQRQILRCLEAGFPSRCARQCIGSLVLCLVEMPRETLLRVLPSILIRLSQMSATVNLSTTVLELLATLAQFPGLYCNFVEEQYLSVFAVALPYTNPVKFSRYVVSLAHYIIGTWFAKSRMIFRPDFVHYITRTLHAVNQVAAKADEGKKMEAVRNDLMEICIDTMARYAFSNCSAPPFRSPLTQFLFENGPTSTWLLGNKLITITTSRVDKMTEKLSSKHPIYDQTNSPVPWPNPSVSFIERQRSSEAPGKLQSGIFSVPSSLPRQRHKSGGAVLKRSVNLSAFEIRSQNSVPDASRKLMGFNSGDGGEQNASNLQYMLTQGWAEIYIRRPSGNTAWSMRIQNPLHSLSESKATEDVLNLQCFLNELKARDAASTKHNITRSTEYEDNDVLLDGKIRSVSNPDSRTAKMENFFIRNRSKTMVGQTPSDVHSGIVTSAPSPLTSSPPLMRHRSHTVSTSKGCAAEAAAATAKLVAERKKSEMISRRGLPGVMMAAESTGQIHQDKEPENEYRDKHYMMENTQYRQAGINSPCFVFLQLFQSAIGTESIHRPIQLSNTPGIERGIQVLDLIVPYDTWATGVVYVGSGEGGDGKAILVRESGSPRYQDLLQGLGELVCLSKCDPSSTFLGGLDTRGEDGSFTYVWKEDVLQMVFHVTTLMPTKSDLSCKMRHIGNDYVMIAYDDDNGRYVPGCVVQGQFRSVEIVVSPLGRKTNRVRYVFHKECVKAAMGPNIGPWLISDDSLAVFVRQLALQANVAAFVCLGGAGAGEYSSKSLARLKQIKRIRSRALQEAAQDIPPHYDLEATRLQLRRESAKANSISKLEEFSDYVR